MTGNELVFPGDEVAVEEEYYASDGTFAENGVIYASQVGILELDDKDCVARVVNAIKTLGGKADVDLKLGRAAVTAPKDLDPQALVDAVNALGFKANLL